MSRYFEVIYPKRLEELKKNLVSISEELKEEILKKSENMENEKILIRKFHDVFQNFLNETRLHITYEIDRLEEKEAMCVTGNYIYQYLKDSEAGRLFKLLYIDRRNGV